jgi:hypothetical protein
MGLRWTLALGGAASFACAIVLVACGIESGGIIDAGDGGPTADASGFSDTLMPDVNLPQACGDAASCLTPALPDGWQITALLADPKAMCPTNFASVDQIKDISLSSGSCACSCHDQGTA